MNTRLSVISLAAVVLFVFATFSTRTTASYSPHENVLQRNTRTPSEYPTDAPPTPTLTPLPALPSDIFAPASVEAEFIEGEDSLIRVQLTNSSSQTRIVQLRLSHNVSEEASYHPSAVAPRFPQTGLPLKGKVDPLLLDAFKNKQQAAENEKVDLTAIVLFDQPDLSAAYAIRDWEKRGQYVYDTLRYAQRDQAAVLAELRGMQDLGSIGSFQSFYGVNAIFVNGFTEGAITRLTGFSEVQYIELALDMQLVPEEGQQAGPTDLPVVQSEWGIFQSGAAQVWEHFGTGKGAVVGIIDTGVDYTHPDLLASYRGNRVGDEYSWMDLVGTCSQPCDEVGHGTHIAGTIAGANTQRYISMAPGADWIAVRACLQFCYTSDIMAAAEWMLAPYRGGTENPQDVRPALRPHVINNSWSGDSRYWFDRVLIAWRAAGIIPVFSAGNDGPNASSIDYPADSPYVLGVGASRRDGTIATFSGRGPGIASEAKPDLVAPGETILSSWLGKTYMYKSGTSMAAPHVVGCVALAVSAGVPIDEIPDVLRNYARPYGQGGFSFDAGHGYLDCYNSISSRQSWIWIDLQNSQISLGPGETRELIIHVRTSHAKVGVNTARLYVSTGFEGGLASMQTVPVSVLVKQRFYSFLPQVIGP